MGFYGTLIKQNLSKFFNKIQINNKNGEKISEIEAMKNDDIIQLQSNEYIDIKVNNGCVEFETLKQIDSISGSLTDEKQLEIILHLHNGTNLTYQYDLSQIQTNINSEYIAETNTLVLN